MDIVTVSRSLCLVAWVAVLIYTTPAVWTIAFGKPLYGDPARLVCWGFSLLTILFCARWFLAPENEGVFAALYVFGAVLAVLTILAAKSYGRERP